MRYPPFLFVQCPLQCEIRTMLEYALQPELVGAVVGVMTLIALGAVRHLLLRGLVTRIPDRQADLRDEFLRALRRPTLLWVSLLAARVGASHAELVPETLRSVEQLVEVLLVISVTVAFASLLGTLAARLLARIQRDAPVSGLIRFIVQGMVYTVGFLILLNTLGVAITPLLTALGVGGFAVAIALQDTLGNLFSGVHIVLESPYRIGDFVRLEDGLEGYVLDIGWRTTRIRQRNNNVVVIPNAKIAASTLINFHLPRQHMRVSMMVGVHYDSDPVEAEQVLLETVRSLAAEHEKVLESPIPDVFFRRFDDSALAFEVRCFIREFSDQDEVLHLLHMRVHERLKRAGINIPYPIRTLQVDPDFPAPRD
jgi:small-conductance mechanosensitive channel